MLAYKDAVDGLYSFSVAEFTRRQELMAKIETRTAQGRWASQTAMFVPIARTAAVVHLSRPLQISDLKVQASMEFQLLTPSTVPT